jgi:hypothetical protein
VLFAHSHTVKLLMSAVPGAPRHCVGARYGAFGSRGWAAYEASAAALLSPSKHVLDLGKLDLATELDLGKLDLATELDLGKLDLATELGGAVVSAGYAHDLAPGVFGRLQATRLPPRSPAAFRRWIEQLRREGEGHGGEGEGHGGEGEGHEGEAAPGVPSEEEMIVGALYGAVVGALLGSAQSLDLDNLGWGDDELEVLGAALGTCRALSGLNLAHNRSIGVRGLTALLVAPELTPGPTPKTALRPQHVLTTALRPQHRALRTLLLSGNPSIGDEGARVLATALHSLPALQVLALDACH